MMRVFIIFIFLVSLATCSQAKDSKKTLKKELFQVIMEIECVLERSDDIEAVVDLKESFEGIFKQYQSKRLVSYHKLKILRNFSRNLNLYLEVRNTQYQVETPNIIINSTVKHGKIILEDSLKAALLTSTKGVSIRGRLLSGILLEINEHGKANKETLKYLEAQNKLHSSNLTRKRKIYLLECKNNLQSTIDEVKGIFRRHHRRHLMGK